MRLEDFDALKKFSSANDHVSFLRGYLSLIENGRQLTLPSGKEIAAAQQHWATILASVTDGFTQEFLTELTRYWVSLLKKKEDAEPPHFVRALINLIDNRPLDTPKLPDSMDLPEGYVLGKPEIASETSQLNPTQSQISRIYRKETQLQHDTPSKKEDIQRHVRDALAKQDEKEFLRFYLYLSRLDEKPAVPLSTAPGRILKEWEEIVTRQFQVRPDPSFLKQLSRVWFNLVHEKGLPTTLKQLQDLWLFFSTK